MAGPDFLQPYSELLYGCQWMSSQAQQAPELSHCPPPQPRKEKKKSIIIYYDVCPFNF